ncbi:MAG TPA: hypothetical protein DDY68_05515, partial [Porphyromonadaceae bacterium]|nr:hypothetical protein [Porphyromonadaceae bacterium]
MEKLTRLFTFIFLIGISLGLLAQKEGSLSIISQPQEVRRRDSILFDSIHNRRTLLLDSIDSIPKDSILLSSVGDSISRDSLYALLKDSIWVDSMNIKTDSIPKDSLDSTRTTKKKKDSGLNEPVVYVAKDSMTFEGNNVATMFGDAQVNYQDIQLNAEFIAMNMDSSNVYAQGSPFKQDSSQTKPLGQPKFKDKSGEYESETMKYNFKSKKGYITNVYTKQGEGYVSGGISKKMPNDDMFMRNGRYTTCDKKDHPHYSFHLSKAKAKQGKNIVTGPANLVVEDFKIPVPIPFGFFPFSKTYSSGVIFPSFGQESTRGYYLKKGGYYFAINDYIDLAITGEIFTNGSWGLNALSYYTKRYKYNGNFNIERLVTITGEKGADDYKEAIDFKVHWTHTQDAKASLTSTFSASVDYSSSKYNQNQLDNAYNPSISAQNTKSSSINYQYRFLGIPLSLSANATINQRSADSTVSVTLPSLNITLSRVRPFRRKEQIGAEKWYEKIYLSYTGQIKNTIQTKEDKLFS